MVGEAIAGLRAFKIMFDIAKAMKNMDDSVKRNLAISELGEQIIAAQTRYTAAIQEVSELKEQLARLETWNAEKQRYELKAFGTGFAYVLKPESAGGEPPHQICANCYNRGKKSFLAKSPSNQASQILGTNRTYDCPECRAKI